jgi:hypothetical protein
VKRFAAAAAILLGLTAPAQAQDAAEDPSDGDHLVVVEQTPWVVPGGAFAMRVRVDDPPDGAQLRMALHNPVRTRSEFARTLDGEGLRSRLTGNVPVPLDDVTVGDDGSVALRIVTGTVTGEPIDVELDADDEGVYPVVVELLDGDDEVVDRLITYLVRLPDPNPEEHPLGAVVVLPLHAPPSHRAPGDVDAATLARLDVTVDALLAHPSVTATLVPTPEALAGAVQADPAAARRLREAVSGRTVVVTPWARLDPVAWRRDGLAAELLLQIAAGQETVGEVTGVDPDTTMAVVGAGGGRAAVDAAVDAGARTLVIDETDLEPVDEEAFPATLTRPFRVEAGDRTVTALQADAGLDAHVGATGDPVLDAHRLLADLAVLALDGPLAERAAAVVLDDDAAADAAFLEALLDGLDQPTRAGAAPLVRAAALDDVVDSVTPAGAAGGADEDDPLVREVLPGDAPASVTAVRDDLVRARAAVSSYRSVFGADDALAADVDELILTAGSASLDNSERDALLGTGIDVMQAQLDGIHGPVRQRVTLTAREGRVQLILGNDTNRPAEVVLELRGERLEFPEHPDGRMPVRLDGGTTRVDLVVRARSSGDAPLDLRLTTPDGRVELGRSRVTVRTTAFSGVGLVLMAAAALFLVVWWTRTIIRERGSSRLRHPTHLRG